MNAFTDDELQEATARIVSRVEWYRSPEGIAHSKDKGYGPASIQRSIITDMLQDAFEEDRRHPVRLIHRALELYAAEDGYDDLDVVEALSVLERVIERLPRIVRGINDKIDVLDTEGNTIARQG